MSRWAAAWGMLGLAGCTSVKLVQRENCWVKKTERWPGRISEELGPCAAPAPPWSDDRVTRAMQECVARADHRWQTQAQLAWSRGEPLPQPSDEAMRICLDEPAKALAGDNEQLRRKAEDMEERLAALARERDELRGRAEEERARREASVGERLAAQERMTDRLLTAQEKAGERLFQGQEALASHLGEAAKKASQPAVATATASSSSDSDGSATTESASTAPVVSPAAPGSAPAARTKHASTRPGRRAPVCPAPEQGAGARNPTAARTSAPSACAPGAPMSATTATAGPGPAGAPQAEVAAVPAPAATSAAPAPSATGAGAEPAVEP